MRSGVTIVVPVKPLDGAKRRLATVLTPFARRELVLEMLSGVLETASRSRADAVLVVSRDPDARRVAERAGVEILEDEENGLNPSLLAGFRRCWRRGHAPLYLPADLPHLDTGAIDALLDAGGADAVVLAPAHDGGTNALMSPPGARLSPSLGIRSFERHLAEARRLGYETRVVRSRALELDVDTPADLEAARSLA